jgi:hypothetical protein
MGRGGRGGPGALVGRRAARPRAHPATALLSASPLAAQGQEAIGTLQLAHATRHHIQAPPRPDQRPIGHLAHSPTAGAPQARPRPTAGRAAGGPAPPRRALRRRRRAPDAAPRARTPWRGASSSGSDAQLGRGV